MEHPSCYRWFSNWIGKNRKKEGGIPILPLLCGWKSDYLGFRWFRQGAHDTQVLRSCSKVLLSSSCHSVWQSSNFSMPRWELVKKWRVPARHGVALDGFGWLTLPAMEPPKWNLQSQRPTRVWSYLLRIRILCVLALVNRHPMFLERVRLCLALEPFCCCYVHPQYQPKFSARPLRANIGFTMSYSAVTTMKPPACRLK